MKKQTLVTAFKALKFQLWTEEKTLERSERNLERHLEQTERAGEKPYEKVLLGHTKRDKDTKARIAELVKAIEEIEEELSK